MLGDLVGLARQRAKLGRDRRHVPKEVEPDMVALHRVDGLQKIALEQRHDRRDLRLRALPVLGRERVDRQVVDAEVLAVRRDPSERLSSGLVPGGARQTAILRPAAVAVHDDRDMHGQRSRLPFSFQHTVPSSRTQTTGRPAAAGCAAIKFPSILFLFWRTSRRSS